VLILVYKAVRDDAPSSHKGEDTKTYLKSIGVREDKLPSTMKGLPKNLRWAYFDKIDTFFTHDNTFETGS
jgi:hypothetical protein